MEVIDILTVNGLMYANIPVWSVKENAFRRPLMLIDTGATITSFGAKELKHLGCYNENKKLKVRTASHAVEVYEVNLPKIQIASFELNDVKAHAHSTFDDFYFDGIIGMNVLGSFNFSVNLDTKTITLQKRT
jgi:predicted aspartyl protease